MNASLNIHGKEDIYYHNYGHVMHSEQTTQENHVGFPSSFLASDTMKSPILMTILSSESTPHYYSVFGPLPKMTTDIFKKMIN